MLKPDALHALAAIVDKHGLTTDPAELLVYEMDATQERATPDGVVFPKSAAEVRKIVQWAAEYHVPLVARGAGTGLSGGALAEKGGIVVEFSRMDRIIELDRVGRSVSVEPGVINLALDAMVKARGLYFPPDPASGRSSSIGGNVAENAGGPHCFKYGVTSNYLTGLEVVLSDGRQVRFGGRAYDYPEYDLLSLVAGSEGTLGLITRIEARLLRNPPGVKTMMAAFDSIAGAGQAVSALIAAGLVPATMELMDQRFMRIVEEFAHAGLPVEAGAILIIEVDGFPASLDAQMSEVVRILEENKAHHLRVAASAEESAKIWYGRKSAAGCMARLAPAYFLVDGTVPRSRLAESIDAVNRICDKYDLQVAYVAHAGDGNLHPFIPFFPSDPDQVRRGWRACEEIMRAAVARDGSITGEHGVGNEKRELMSFMCDGAELAAMREVKADFDPAEMMNPCKIFPSAMPPVKRAGPLVPTPYDAFTPASADETAAALAAFTRAKRKVGVNVKRSGQAMLSTEKLRGIVRYEPDDMYITIGAGTPLTEVQAFLARDRRQVPLTSPWEETTVGALVAVNLNSPQRMRYGAVRDLVLCCTAALADGRLIRAGRALVKNVAGYDLPKVFVGSYGTLGVLTDVTFKVAPLPRAKRTLFVPVDDLARGLALGSQLLQVALTASAIVLVNPSPQPPNPPAPLLKGKGEKSLALVYTAEGFPEDVETELAQVRDVLRQADAPGPLEVTVPTGTEQWSDLMRSATPASLNVRVGVPPKELSQYAAARAAELMDNRCIVDIASGMVYAVAECRDVNDGKAWLDALRKPALAAGGYAIASFVPEEWRGHIDRWGYEPETLTLMRALKARWDPENILGDGEFIV